MEGAPKFRTPGTANGGRRVQAKSGVSSTDQNTRLSELGDTRDDSFFKSQKFIIDPREQSMKDISLKSGMTSLGVKTQTKMMSAFMSKKASEEQNMQLKARILKLHTEHEKAQKHIKDMNRQQNLMNNMHKEKQDRRQEFHNLRTTQKNEEDCDRQTFNIRRLSTANNIEKNRMSVTKTNLSKGLQYKDESKQLQSKINSNYSSNLTDKQNKYRFGKSQHIKAKTKLMNDINNDYSQTQSYYQVRIYNVDKQKQDIDANSKALEKQESELLKKLQMTQANEFKLADQIQSLSSQHHQKFMARPVGQPSVFVKK